MNNDSSQIFESYLPVYDTVPEKWDDARPFLVEQLKKISNAVNTREISWLLDEELLSGKQFVPSSTNTTGEMQQFRAVFRKVVDLGTLVAGVNLGVPHGITVDSNFTLVDMWVAATDSAIPIAQVITDSNVTIDSMNINVTSPGAFDRAWCIIEFLQEV